MTDARPASLLTIDLGALVENWRRLAARVAPAACAGIVKADGYGLGAGPVGRALYRAGCRNFFVARLNEGLELRDYVGEDAMVCVLDGLGIDEAPLFRRRDLTPALNDPGQIALWAASARAAGEKLKAVIHFDTGMSRLGLSPAETDALIADPSVLAAFDLRYVMSHLVSSEERANPLNGLQLDRFKRVRAAFPLAPASFANSSGVFLGTDYHFDLARPGCAIYGINPTPGLENPVRTVARLEARILQVREIDHPQTVGYGATWQATRATKVATIACGYADGWLRSLSDRGAAYIGQTQAPFLGRVSMDLITIDVSNVPDARPGQMVELLGTHMTVDEVAERAGTNGYEVLTRLGKRFARNYLEPAA